MNWIILPLVKWMSYIGWFVSGDKQIIKKPISYSQFMNIFANPVLSSTESDHA